MNERSNDIPNEEPLSESEILENEELGSALISDTEPLEEDIKKRRRRAKRKRNVPKALLIIFISLAAFILLLLATFLILREIGREQMLELDKAQVTLSQEVEEEIGAASESDGKQITYKGERYRLNESVTTILCMGIDKRELSSEGFGANGQADANILLVIDTSSGKTDALCINRDTMIDANVYSDSGMFLGAESQQLCLAFANGDGNEKSCENMKLAVSSLLYGIPINSYMAIDMEAIGTLNSLVGGVTVTSPETFSYGSDIHFKEGQTVTLSTPLMAEGYVRYRDVSVLDSNITRMKRQKTYLSAFAKAAVKKTKEDITFPLSLYSAVNEYNSNDLSAPKITFLTSTIIKGRENINLNFHYLSGKTEMGEKNAEFYPDEKQLFELILKLFYIKEIK